MVQVADRECGPNLVDRCQPVSDCATITIDSARLTTRLVATDQVHTTNSDVVIGEILTYETVITVPEGSSPDAVLVQDLDPGLSLVCVDRISYGDGVASSAAPQPGEVVPFDADGGEANRFVIDFGDIRNDNRDNRVADTITVVYRAVATNIWSSQDGAQLGAAAGWRSSDGEPLVDLHAEAQAATVVEPVLDVAVTTDGEAVRVGEATFLTVTIRNEGDIDAFDVSIDDIALPPGLRLSPGSWAPAAGEVAMPVLRAGDAASFTLAAMVTAEARPGEALGVDVTVRYTSLPEGTADCGCDGSARGGEQDRSSFVDGSDTERTGEDGPGGLNDYVAMDDASVVPVSPPCPPPPPVCAPPPPLDCAPAPPQPSPPGPPPPAGPPPVSSPPAEPPGSPPPAEPPPVSPPVSPPADPPVSPPSAEPSPVSPPVSPPADQPVSPPTGEPPPIAPPPAEPPPVSPPPPVGSPPDVPPPVSGQPPGSVPVPPAGSGRPGMPTDDPWPGRGGALLDDLPPAAMLTPLGMADPFARDPLRPGDIRLPGAEERPTPAGTAKEVPIGKDDECVPAKPVAEKPRPVKRSVFVDGAPRPERPPFSEQVGAAKKRIAPPVVVKARPAPDC
jgi:uncharacterized repeat protein (TIGR01451 family)